MIKSVMPYFLGLFIIVIVAEEKSCRNFFACADNDFACLACFYGLSIRVNYINIIKHARFAH